MLGRLIFFAIGYVLGTRAGRERWNDIARAASWVAQREETQAAAGMARDALRLGIDRCRELVLGALPSKRRTAPEAARPTRIG
jgi:hypothetical protein